MSRMDRYKHIHEQSQKSERRKERFRKTTDSQDVDFVEPIQQSFEKVETTKSLNSNKNIPVAKPPKKKKGTKRKVFRFIFTLLILLVAYVGGSFVFGQQVAKKETSTVHPEEFNGFTSSDGANNILLIGSDSRDGEVSRADTIMVLQLDGPSKKPKLISFMRDTYVSIPGVGENKINAAYAYGGAELVRKTLSQNFGIETKYYVIVDFKSFEKVIDTLFPDGVYIDAEKDMSKYLEKAIKKGPQQMDGLTLLQYARFRMDEEGDFGRVRRQQQVIEGVFSEMKNPITLAKLPYATGKVFGYAATNLPTTFLLKNALIIAKGASGVDRLTVPVKNSWEFGQTYEAGSVLFIDLDANKQAIQKFLTK